MLRFLLTLAAVTAVCAACVGPMVAGPSDGRGQTGILTGTWGGEHVALTVTEQGAHFEFDCASGDITQPLATDSEGRLDVVGVFVQERGGPVRSDDPPQAKPARYRGRLTGATLTFDVVLIESDAPAGSFTVVHAAEPRVRKCR
jgi:hypothetical protein